MNHILIVEDEKNYRLVLGELLRDAGYRVSLAENPFAALELLSREGVALILSDLKMPQMDGLEFYRNVVDHYGNLPFILMTAYATVETALKALKAGVHDYLLKPFNNDEVLLVIRQALEHFRIQIENQALRRQLEKSYGRELVGESPSVRQLQEQIARIAPAPSPVLICGESGVGKELVARTIHRFSHRNNGPWVVVNCATFPENLLESELFGHERGAFTGATERKKGLVEMADGGSLFLDEIGELPLVMQPKLLRFLQEKSFRRVGGTIELQADVRLITASNRDLRAMVAAGTFREDLYYRLNVVELVVPPLRERIADIPLLAQYFLQNLAADLNHNVTGISPTAMELLKNYHWPGNIRELRNTIERALLFCNGSQLEPDDLPAELFADADGCTVKTDRSMPAITAGESLRDFLEKAEKAAIHNALIEARGIQAQAARRLGISRSNLQYKLKKYHLGDT
ncbi:two-component system NtrC family response regulator/two-component system response regulator AtoC [Geothermobacter ehrlichii]|uniref:Two-component system NtrC family response regulator/two-component system response regulator AtoC n=1 Tax=Geothermobacter ehrlichii TaxID=213224 RepID=A0A5D3WHY2_9BACT|nr:sigma-54 dependent transcriptional regulator [Geothermobacter ehrlichii]TYO97696.1 two-component system NtrC family response regulator/two-component system response regulator AtoC [Geothermobacter ehrlichii]